MHICINCGSLNGVVKKCGMLKICHDKYRYAKNGEQVKRVKSKPIYLVIYY